MGVSVIEERSDSGGIIQTYLAEEGVTVTGSSLSEKGAHHVGWIYIVDLLTRVFLPAGYPNSVSPDYLRYQVLNALQAFCNSLAGLLSSRAILQGFGVGDPTASATTALLLTVLQDVFGRLTTILSAHLIGSSLYPEAKTYRLLADVLNDTAVILDTLSPFFNSFSIPGLRIAFLCLSAIFKSLCSISAGGSKAAITMHFATPLTGKGDVGDLNAKDASKETVLALLGMLLGTLIVPYVSTPFTTYTSLFVLVGLHLGINYYGVRGLILRSLNRQRLGIAWQMYKISPASKAPAPSKVAQLERIFDFSGIIYDVNSSSPLGKCAIGSSFSEIVRGDCHPALLDLFAGDRYIIWFDHGCLRQEQDDTILCGPITRLHIFLKDGYTNDDQLRAWIQSVEVCKITTSTRQQNILQPISALSLLKTTHGQVSSQYRDFVKKLQSVGWNTDDSAIMTGSPASVITNISIEDHLPEDRKTR